MKRLNPDKLTTTFDGVNRRNPIIPRQYTLTHSDETAELFLVVGRQISYQAIGPMRDEVIAKWRLCQGKYTLYGMVHVDDDTGIQTASAVRYKIFQREMPLALEAIRYGDRKFFETHPSLDQAQIWIAFVSCYPEFDELQYWGTPNRYVYY